MKAELNHDLGRRAAVHAALSDPARLAVTDALSDGDASPSELAVMLGMPSNLLAHHLRVLEESGLVTRQRSEGDRRRTYWRLVPGALESLAGPPGRAARRVLFVCTANSARSHLAAALWRQASAVPAASAGECGEPGGAGGPARRGLPLPEVRPRPVSDVLREGDLVITVCDLAHEELAGAAAVHWSVPDPVPAVMTADAFPHPDHPESQPFPPSRHYLSDRGEAHPAAPGRSRGCGSSTDDIRPITEGSTR